ALERSGAAAVALARQLSGQLLAVRQRVAALSLCDTRSRIAQALLSLGEDRGSPDGTPIPIEVTQHELAALVGATRQTVNSVLRSFDREGLTELRRCRVLVLEPARLRETAELGGAA